jgi:hypothetical protein
MKVVRLSALGTSRLYPQKIFLVLISVRVWVNPRATVRPEGICEWKIPMTLSGIEPVTFRLVAQCVKQMRHRVSPCQKYVTAFMLWDEMIFAYHWPHCNRAFEIIQVFFCPTLNIVPISNITFLQCYTGTKYIKTILTYLFHGEESFLRS